MGPEETRLTKRLSSAKAFNVFWGAKAAEMSAEERAKMLNDTLDRVSESRARGEPSNPPMSGKAKVDVRTWLSEKMET